MNTILHLAIIRTSPISSVMATQRLPHPWPAFLNGVLKMGKKKKGAASRLDNSKCQLATVTFLIVCYCCLKSRFRAVGWEMIWCGSQMRTRGCCLVLILHWPHGCMKTFTARRAQVGLMGYIPPVPSLWPSQVKLNRQICTAFIMMCCVSSASQLEQQLVFGVAS